MHHLPDVGSSARWHDNKGNNDSKDEMDATAMTFPTTDDLQRYATLLIKTGVNLQPGQGLVIRAELAHAELARLAVAEGYRAGAGYVQVDWYDAPAAAAVLATADVDKLEVPAYEVARFRQMTDERWARLALVGPEFPEAFDAVAPQAMRTWAVKRTRAVKFYSEAQMANRMQWCVAAVPTPAWATRVYPDLPANEATAELWRMIFQFVRIDQPDPVAAWGDLNRRLKSAAEYLHRHNVRAVHFFDPTPASDGKPSTDLTIGLADTARWVGGASTTPTGVAFQPNVPSEEIFSAPHRRHVEGYVRTSRPSYPMQREVDGAYFRFESGAIVEYHAERGEDVLAQFLTIDGAKHLGEVALVDVDSPIFRSGRVFYEILFDENAACHIAFGEAYPVCIEHGDELSPEAQEAAGLNRAETHVDFMIGTPTMHIHGITATGDKVPIMENGRFVAAVTA